jgi:hypothetical protein
MEIGGLWSKVLPSFRQTKLIKYKLYPEMMSNTKDVLNMLKEFSTGVTRTTGKSKIF